MLTITTSLIAENAFVNIAAEFCHIEQWSERNKYHQQRRDLLSQRDRATASVCC